MLFNSIEFALFLPIVLIFYWFITNNNLRNQNFLLLAASYFFYSWWDWRFLFLLVVMSLLNYFVGLEIENNQQKSRIKRAWLAVGLVGNLGILLYFKYYSFFVDGFIELVALTGYVLPRSSTNIVLPLGISFFVFISLSYIIDIYRGTLYAERDIIAVLLTQCFFPIIIAGPIQRPSTLVPQIKKKREFNNYQVTDGLRQILWGLFAKVVIADNLAPYVDMIFLSSADYSGSTLFLGAVFFSIQIYADFSGYSNMAIGTAKLFGFTLMKNFAFPYFSRNISEFWKKWHISLTTWFRDYVFLPISFSLASIIKKERVLFIRSDIFVYIIASIITWSITGLWHGATYGFVFWGLINGIFLIIYQLQKKPLRESLKRMQIDSKNTVFVIIESLFTFVMISCAWIVFRSGNIDQAFQYFKGLFSASILSKPNIVPVIAIMFAMVFIATEWLQRRKEHALQIENIKPVFFRWSIYYVVFIAIFFLRGSEQQFIYTQF